MDEVQPGTPAAQAGLRAGDAIQSVDGHAFHNVTTLLAYMQAGKGKPVSLVVLRNGVTLPPIVAHPSRARFRLEAGLCAGADSSSATTRSPRTRRSLSQRFCADNSTLIVEVLGRIFTRKVAVSQLSGPVGIARMAGKAAEMNGWVPKFGLAAAISLNLGILNLLPFPILDGGVIFLLLIESVLRRDISVNVKERIISAAAVMIVVFFAFTVFNDVIKLPIFAHLKQ